MSTSNTYITKQDLIDSGLWHTCLNCDEFIEEEERCNKYKERPPARVLVNGCEDWVLLIPF